MKKQIIFLAWAIITIVIILGVIIAGGSLLKSNSSILLSANSLNTLNTKGIQNINVISSPIMCDDKECWSDVKQEGLIQTQFRTQKSYCIKNGEEIDEINKTIYVCIEYKDYTKEELIKQRDEFIKKRISDYVDSIKSIQDKSPIITQIDDGGVITSR